MANGDGDDDHALLTEPAIIDCVFCEGIEIELRNEVVRIVGWIRLETLMDPNPPERRIVARAVMPTATARELIRDLRRKLTRGGN